MDNGDEGELKDKFITVAGRLGDHYEKTEKWEKAVELYRKVLEVDKTQTGFYERLVSCRQHEEREGGIH